MSEKYKIRNTESLYFIKRTITDKMIEPHWRAFAKRAQAMKSCG